MAISDVIAHIDAEIAKLQQVKSLLSGTDVEAEAPKSKRGRPKGSKNAASSAVPVAVAKKVAKGKRQLTDEGRKAIADAMKRRWAERRKQTTK